MKNRLNRRILREIRDEAGKYMVIFLFMTAMIGIVSGFLIADDSLKTAYDESFEKYNVEDGNFELAEKADHALTKTIEEENIQIYNNFYKELETKKIDSTLRIFADRKEVNKVCLLSGTMPKKEDEIALDRLYAKNNQIAQGDSIKVDQTSLKVTGIVALPDYSALFSNNSDMMFDSIKFGVAVMTESGFEALPDKNMHYSYSWKYDTPPKDPKGKQAKKMSEDLVKALGQKAPITNYIPRYLSSAINFAGDDMGDDRSMFLTILYILIVIIAFVFAITTSNTISREANVIGTLRASGYTKAELVRHYMAAPMLVLLLAALVGNILGYTYFKEVMADLYLGSYSLTSYKTVWNATAFIETTVIPVLIMMLINFVILTRKLSLSPLKFLRRDLKRRQRKKAFKLNTKIKIMTRFKLRVLFQNVPNYITIFVGILFAEIILIFGTMFTPLLDYVEEQTVSNMIAKHQYVLKAPTETKTKNAEKYCMESLKTTGSDFSEEIAIYGIADDSRYVDEDLSDGKVQISSAYSDKYGLQKGDTIQLKNEFGDKKYKFKIDGIYENPTTLAVFMSRETFNETFDKEKDYYSGYFSDKEIKDIDEEWIASEITKNDYTKTSRQLKKSMGNMMTAFWFMGVMVFMLIIYLLAKIVIEKNAQSISITKILGYEKKEINSIYIHTTTIVTIVSLVLVIPLVSVALNLVWHLMMQTYSGWLPCVISNTVYLKVIVTGVVTYAIV
ncbi:MAG: FtsX-like permease family protein, partial [Lachnospiraceae bacterium]